MTQEIIEMARESGMDLYGLGKDRYRFVHHLEAFAKLVEDKVTARYMQLFLDPENQPTQFGTATQEYREQEIKDERKAFAAHAVDIARRAVAEEREACAKLCEDIDSLHDWYGERVELFCADAIRARGEPTLRGES